MNAQDILTKEHLLILNYLDTVKRVVRQLEKGRLFPREFFDSFVAFARGFVDRHQHFKDEQVMFAMRELLDAVD